MNNGGMKMNKLENFIRDNRAEFDNHEVPEGLWGRIDASLDEVKQENGKVRRFSFGSVAKIAAILVVVFSMGIFFWKYQQVNSGDVVAGVDPQLSKEQVHYASLIELKRSELEELKTRQPELYKEFAGEINKMDSSYQKLKETLPVSPDREKTIKAMIKNLQLQIQVLNQQLNIIEQIKQNTNRNEDISI